MGDNLKVPYPSQNMELPRTDVIYGSLKTKIRSLPSFPLSYRKNSWNISGISKGRFNGSWIETVCIFFLKQWEVCIEFGFDDKAYWVEGTSVTGEFAEATAAAGVMFSLRTLISFITFRVARFRIEAFWLSSPFTRTSWSSCVKAIRGTLIFRAISGSGKLIYSFNITRMAFYNQYFFVFGWKSKVNIGRYHAEFKMQRNKKCSWVPSCFNCF